MYKFTFKKEAVDKAVMRAMQEAVLGVSADESMGAEIVRVECFEESMLTIVQSCKMLARLHVQLDDQGSVMGFASHLGLRTTMLVNEFFDQLGASESLIFEHKELLRSLELRERALLAVELHPPGIALFAFPTPEEAVMFRHNSSEDQNYQTKMEPVARFVAGLMERDPRCSVKEFRLVV